MDIQELLARLDQHKGSFPKDLVEGSHRAAGGSNTPDSREILEDLDRNPGTVAGR